VEKSVLFSSELTRNPNNVVRTKSLFLELCYLNPEFAIFTTKEEDHHHNGKVYVSLSKLYLSIVPSDPTEYDFSQVVFGSWHTWDVIRSSPQIKPFYNRWRKEVEVKIKSKAIQAIAQEMAEGGRSSFSAAKLLLDRGWIEKDTVSVAKKKLMEKEEEELNKEALSLLSEDAERLGLKVN
jgi:hypothetical protein